MFKNYLYFNHLHDYVEFKYKTFIIGIHTWPGYCYILEYDITDSPFPTLKEPSVSLDV